MCKRAEMVWTCMCLRLCEWFFFTSFSTCSFSYLLLVLLLLLCCWFTYDEVVNKLKVDDAWMTWSAVTLPILLKMLRVNNEIIIMKTSN